MKTLAAAAVLVLAPLATPLAADAAAGERCQGQPATVVGAPGTNANGTAGPDVIVSGGASFVNGGDGDDLLCITGSTDDGYRVRVTGGAGDDSVLVTTFNTVRTFLGHGRDTYVGGSGRDLVQGGSIDHFDDGESDAYDEYSDREKDTISTGDGADGVTASNGDSVALGAGNDHVGWLFAAGDPAATMVGGPGHDTLGLIGFLERGNVKATWVLDTRSRTLTRDSEVVASFTGFAHYYPHVPGDLVVRGSRRAETFTVTPGNSYGTAGSSLALHAGGGDDEIEVLAVDVDLRTRVLDGGAGRDLVHVRGWEFVEAALVLDLAAGGYRYQDGDGRGRARFVNVEDAEVEDIPQVTMRGDSSANRLTVHADQTDWPVFKRCQVVMSGSGGDDAVTLESAKVDDSWTNCPAPVLRGDGGDDELVGSLLPERLIGGPGRDVARGGPGRDVCVAETRMGCERR